MKLQNTFIEMYRPDQYKSWEEAAELGGIHSSIVFSVDEPAGIAGKLFLDDMLEAAHSAAMMMDGNGEIRTRVVRRDV